MALAVATASIGLSLMAWYAYHLRGTHPGQEVRAAGNSRNAAASEMRLPPIEMRHEAAALTPSEVSTVPPAAPPGSGASAVVPSILRPGGANDPAPDPAMRSSSAAPVLVRAETDLAARALSPPDVPDLTTAAAQALGAAEADLAQKSGHDGSAPTAIVDATLLPAGRWLLQKGTFLDCTLETAIDSTLAGLATCMIAADVYGSDGRVVLMERGTRLIGEVHGDVHAGQSRVAVAWTDARTPAGVRLALLSMATDSVGRAGVPGLVDRHFGERFGAAVLLSFVDGAATALTARQQGQASVVYNAQPSRDIATEALRSSIGIPPTIRVAQGTRIQVIVASDVNFRSVYRLAAREQR
jgi:type IV secretion system protein VirB10